MLSSAVFCLVFIAAAIAPAPVAILCGAVLFLQLGKLIAGFGIRPVAAVACATKAGTRPVFSVHVATHNEPPDMVIDTLNALARQDYPRDLFEVIVMDNNTADPELWMPVQAACASLGPRFRFLHQTGVTGAKAGALNIALTAARADASHIVTVDADYRVVPSFLSEAAEALRESGADYVQFPQAYARSDSRPAGVDMELEDYFRTDAEMADGAEAVLLTGTLSVISRAALTSVGGWSGQTTTEDAELGVRLCAAGFRGRYIGSVTGNGYLPFTLRDLDAQRYRWASGNLRTLFHHLPVLARPAGRLSLRQVRAVVAQLGAWLNFSLVPVAALSGALILTRNPDSMLLRIAALCVLLSLTEIALRLLRRGLHDRRPFGVVVQAFAARLALAPVAARATVDACLPMELRFTVTAKRPETAITLRDVPLDRLILLTLVILAAPAAAAAEPLVWLAWGAMALPVPAALMIQKQLLRYRTGIATQGVMA